MSSLERNKGKMTPTGVKTAGMSWEELDEIYDSGDKIIVNGEVYSVEWEVYSETDDMSFSDVVKNEDGTITFHTIHYNGGGSLSEVIEQSLAR